MAYSLKISLSRKFKIHSELPVDVEQSIRENKPIGVVADHDISGAFATARRQNPQVILVAISNDGAVRHNRHVNFVLRTPLTKSINSTLERCLSET